MDHRHPNCSNYTVSNLRGWQLTKKILIVDDEEAIVRLLAYHLERDGYDTLAAYDGKTALKIIREHDLDLVILDIMLPEISGWDVLRVARSEGKSFPVILLSARDEEVDRVAGLELGADDYVTKPFSPRELVARVRAQLRRMDIATSEAEKEENVTESTPRPDSIDPMTHSSAIRGQPAVSRDRILTVGYVTANIDSREVFVSQKPVDLTAKEFDLMVYMMNRPRRVFTRGDLLSAVWGYDFEGDTRTVDVHISRLRQKIDPLIHELAQTHGTDCPESFLETIRGVGYRLVSGANYTAVGKDDTFPKKQGG